MRKITQPSVDYDFCRLIFPGRYDLLDENQIVCLKSFPAII